MTGTFHVVGVGPGDPELLTLKAIRIIATCHVVAYPSTESGATMARDIAASHVRSCQVEIPFLVPMRVDRAPAQEAYANAAQAIAEELRAGKDVALLCEGDPFFYGSAMYLHHQLAAEFKTIIVPGVSSLTACAAETGRPLAARNDVLKVLPAPLAGDRLAAEIRNAEAVAIIKVGRHFEKVRKVLRDLALETKAYVVESATLSQQNVRPLTAFDDASAPYFSTILVYQGDESWA